MTTKDRDRGIRQEAIGRLAKENNVTLGAVAGPRRYVRPARFLSPGDTLGTDCASYQAALCGGNSNWPAGFTSKQALRSGSTKYTHDHPAPPPGRWICPGSYPYPGTTSGPFPRMTAGKRGIHRPARPRPSSTTTRRSGPCVTPATTGSWTNPYTLRAHRGDRRQDGAAVSGATRCWSTPRPCSFRAERPRRPSPAAPHGPRSTERSTLLVHPGAPSPRLLHRDPDGPSPIYSRSRCLTPIRPRRADTKRIEYLRAKPSGPGPSIIPRTRTTEGPIPRRLRPSPSRRSSRPTSALGRSPGLGPVVRMRGHHSTGLPKGVHGGFSLPLRRARRTPVLGGRHDRSE